MSPEGQNSLSQAHDLEIFRHGGRFKEFGPRTPALYDYAAYDLNAANKSILRRELYQRLDQGGFTLEEVLFDWHKRLVESYLPRNGRLLGQEEVSLRLYGDPRTSGFKRTLRHGFFRVDGRYYLGPGAIEVLKPENFYYRILLSERLYLIDQVLALEGKPEDVIEKFKRRFIFEEVKGLLENKGFEFNPDFGELKFFEELPPHEAFEHSMGLRK